MPLQFATVSMPPPSRLRASPYMPAQRFGGTARREIERAVAHVFEVASAEIDLPRRGKARVALARQTAIYLVHVTCHLTMTEVGMFFERDRTTVRHACKLIEDMRDDRAFDLALQCLEGVVRHIVELCAPPSS